MTGIQLDRTPNNYVIRVMKRGKCVEWVTYNNIDEMISWFNCLQFMKYGKKIATQGKTYFRKEVAKQVYKWREEDEYMTRMSKLYNNRNYQGLFYNRN